ncbi:MAG: hypothetical protein HZC55_14660 [Verrucomicrobia bacterium]|nr:hypothetical protein [Verrucomicrobiota bacterium]
MLILGNAELRLELLDPADPPDQARQGARYCWGGYLWQVHDLRLGPLVAGPEFPHPTPTPFNGQGLPESFRHRTRDGRPLTWRGREGLGLGAGRLTADEKGEVSLTEPCTWHVTRGPGHLSFQTRQAGAGFSCELSREIELRDRSVISRSRLTNAGDTALTLEWFAHPFWCLTRGEARVRLPLGTTVPDNPGFAIDRDGLLTFRRPFRTPEDSQFALLDLPAGQALRLELDHPRLSRVTFATSFIPNECPVWANAQTLSIEPYLHLSLAPGETRAWQIEHGFEA